MTKATAADKAAFWELVRAWQKADRAVAHRRNLQTAANAAARDADQKLAEAIDEANRTWSLIRNTLTQGKDW